MSVFVGISQPIVLSAFYSALEKQPIAERPSVTATSEESEEPTDTGAIQQASWSEVTPQVAPATAVAVAQPVYKAVRDDAPSSMVVIACLVGVALFSLILCLSTLPHHWFHRNSTRWRERKGW